MRDRTSELGSRITRQNICTVFHRLLHRFLAPRWVGRLLYATAAASGLTAVALSAAVHFQLLPSPDSPTSMTLSPGLPGFGSQSFTADADRPVRDWKFDRERVLSDADERISPEFKIPDAMKERVAFWFDVYTKWDDNHRVIHHSRHPWIVFHVVDVSEIINDENPRRLWMRREKANKFAEAEANRIRGAIVSLSRKGPVSQLTETEEQVAKALSALGDDVHKQARLAIGNVRTQTGQKNFFREGLAVSSRYLPSMEEIFRKHRLPVELTRIPFVESSFNKQATSKVGASGIWQFMDGTGRKFMLVTDQIDERRSPLKATVAAAKLLKENHMILYRSWPLAVTAWNHGPGGIRKAAQAAGTRDLAVIVSKYRSKSFDFASSNFYAEFLAALHAERYSDLAFAPLERESPLDLQLVRLPRAVRIQELIRVTGLSLDEFIMLNPELRTVAKNNLSLPLGFQIHVPTSARLSIERLFARDGHSAPKSVADTAKRPS
jgi:membrane-bound lytic murein transglycosylase D